MLRRIVTTQEKQTVFIRIAYAVDTLSRWLVLSILFTPTDNVMKLTYILKCYSVILRHQVHHYITPACRESRLIESYTLSGPDPTVCQGRVRRRRRTSKRWENTLVADRWPIPACSPVVPKQGGEWSPPRVDQMMVTPLRSIKWNWRFLTLL